MASVAARGVAASPAAEPPSDPSDPTYLHLRPRTVPPPRRRANDQIEQSRAHDAVVSGAAVSLMEVLPVVNRAAPGEVLDVTLDKTSAIWTYQVTVLTADGRYCDLTIDARHNQVLATRWR